MGLSPSVALHRRGCIHAGGRPTKLLCNLRYVTGCARRWRERSEESPTSFAKLRRFAQNDICQMVILQIP